VAHFRAPDKDVEIVLYGVVHIADGEYYARVQQDLDSYGVVLWEGVAPGKEAPTDADKGLGELQGAMGEMLGLTFQKDGIDYTRKNLVHADMNMDQPFLKMIASLGKALMQGNPAMQNQLKMQMGRQLGSADSNQLAQGLGKKAADVILYERNKVALDVLKKQLETTKDGTIAIFYGAAHMPDLEAKLGEMGFARTSKRWMTAWKIGEGMGEDEAAAPGAPTQTPAPTPQPKGPRWF
jgi:hypothetical protein